MSTTIEKRSDKKPKSQGVSEVIEAGSFSMVCIIPSELMDEPLFVRPVSEKRPRRRKRKNRTPSLPKRA